MAGTSAGSGRREGSPPEHPGALVRRLMYAARLTEEGLAHAAGASYRTINRIICMHSEFSAKMAVRLAGPLQTTAERLHEAVSRYDVWRAQEKAAANPPVEPPRPGPVQRGDVLATEGDGSNSGLGKIGKAGGPKPAPRSSSASSPGTAADAAVSPAKASTSGKPRRKRSSHSPQSDKPGSSRKASE